VGRLGLRPSGVLHLGVHRLVMNAWGASDDVRPDAAADAFPALLRHLPDGDARKWGDPARDVPAQGDCPSALLAVPLPDARARSKPGAHLSAA